MRPVELVSTCVRCEIALAVLPYIAPTMNSFPGALRS
jgi:hypothetical protein